jgi:hypothetical protein
VAKPIDLDLGERDCAGRIVIKGLPKRGTLIADCRNDYLPLDQQLANAALVAKAPQMAQALLDLEDKIGDLPASKTADILYQLVTDALKAIGITPREDPDVIG